MKLTATVNLKDVHRFLSATRGALTHGQAGWKAAAMIYYQHVSQVFRAEGLPDKWKPLAAATLRRRRQGRNKDRQGATGILKSTGLLSHSASGPNAPGSYLRISSTRMIIGSTLKYAGTHNYGYKHIPQREFLTITPAVSTKMAAAFLRVVARRLRSK